MFKYITHWTVAAITALLLLFAHYQDSTVVETLRLKQFDLLQQQDIPQTSQDIMQLFKSLHEKGMTLTMEHNFWHTPPVDALFIHRKLGGLFLLAKRLKAQVNMRKAASIWLKS